MNRALCFAYLVCILIAGSFSSGNAKPIELSSNDTVGLFKNSDPRLEGIIWGNWGSRPYEYRWVSSVVDVEGKRVIDLGVGLPSDYNWYLYVTRKLRPLLYVGIDGDGRMMQEQLAFRGCIMQFMDMSNIDYPQQYFDVAYCISTYEHIPYNVFMKTIEETYRILKNDGILVLTLDERWDKNLEATHDNSWNDLEKSLSTHPLLVQQENSFGLPHFLELVKDYFVLYDDRLEVTPSHEIVSSVTGEVYYKKCNADSSILNSGPVYNSCVSYAVLKKKL